MKPLILFGCGDFAEIAHLYFEAAGRQVVAFTIDEADPGSPTFCDKPVLPFAQLPSTHPPEAYDLFVAIGYTRLNQGRSAVFQRCLSAGYTLASYISPDASCHASATVGRNVFIFEHNVIQPFVRIGDDVILWSGNHIGHHSVVEDHCFLASHVVVSGRVQIGHHTFIGVNATITDHLRVAPHNLIGAGSLISSDTAEGAVYRPPTLKPSRVPSHRLWK